MTSAIKAQNRTWAGHNLARSYERPCDTVLGATPGVHAGFYAKCWNVRGVQRACGLASGLQADSSAQDGHERYGYRPGKHDGSGHMSVSGSSPKSTRPTV